MFGNGSGYNFVVSQVYGTNQKCNAF